MRDLTIIVPLVEYKEAHDTQIDRCYKSIVAADADKTCSVIFIGPSSAIAKVKDLDMEGREVLYLENNKNVELPYQVTKAVKDVTTEFFTVLEFDDEITPNWLKHVETYVKYQDETSLFLPLIEIFNELNLQVGAVAYGNEPVWAASFSDEIGYFDTTSLKNFVNVVVSGGVFRKKDFVSVGCLKPSLQVFFWYELLLRMTHNDKKIFVIPKIGCNHYVNREDSLTSSFRKMTPKELDFWFKTAQDEYLFKTDRKKVYNPESETETEE